MNGVELASAMILSTGLAIAAVLASGAETAPTPRFDLGKSEYEAKCPVCHGTLEKGDGPYAGLLTVEIPDLTRLSAKNNGRLPFLWVQEVIDGRQAFRAHGPKNMLIWGLNYLAKARESSREVAFDPEDYVRTRILALTEYVARLQAK